MRNFTRIAAVILSALLVQIFASIYIEYGEMRDRDFAMNQAINLAYSHTVRGIQQIDNSYAASLANNPDELIAYCNTLKNQAGASPQLVKICNFMIANANTSNSYSPIQFGLTYIDKREFRRLYEETLKEYIRLNYGNDTTPPLLGGHIQGTIRIDSVNVTVTGPIVNTIDSGSTVLKQVFGTADPSVMNAAGLSDPMFDTIISYRVDIDITWTSVTTTPWFNNVAMPGSIKYTGPVLRLKNQAMLTGLESKISRTFALTN